MRKIIRSPIGNLQIITEDSLLVQINLTEENHSDNASEITCEVTEKQLREYFSGLRREFTLPILPKGTEFQRKVWDALISIPYGETRTYGEIAEAIGNPKAVRAVGMACHRNPIPIVIPCHRVVAANGIGGFAYGLDVKSALIRLENTCKLRDDAV